MGKDIKLQPDNRLDENRLASCCTSQWWIDFLCCKSDEASMEEEQRVTSEKHLKLNEKTIENLEYEKDHYALLDKNSSVSPISAQKVEV